LKGCHRSSLVSGSVLRIVTTSLVVANIPDWPFQVREKGWQFSRATTPWVALRMWAMLTSALGERSAS
jgi:hypothetical protein